MTRDDVLAAVERVRASAGDDEAAHSMEDRLHQEVLAAIALDPADASALARLALCTQDIQFDRWCA